MKAQSIPVRVIPSRGQSKEWKTFVEALKSGQISLARDLITHIFVYTEVNTSSGKYPAKKFGYELIFNLAQKSGDLDSMLEVAPFTGHVVSKQDYVECKKGASKAHRKKDKIACKKILKRKWFD